MAWKMFAINLIVTFLLAYTTAEIPSYMHVCGRKNSDLNKCIMNSIEDLRENICHGIPELKSPPLEPFVINKLIISDVDNAKMYVKDAHISELCHFKLDSFNIDLSKLHFDAVISFNKVPINGTYDFDVRVLVPFSNKGPVFLTAGDIVANLGVDLTMVNKGDKNYVYVSKLNLQLDIKTLDSKFDEGEKDLGQLNEILSSFLGSNQQEFINKVKPSIEKEISEKIIVIANTILKHFTYDELFPDRE
ncbi:hypothetical protein PUN28_018777 [Cardiocondyla obscurior]|uniref:Uncharacterized protein n=1 Tax=Cardiocondyla obscurior TaxID=286306 RepID=A0AAW2EHC1_9HYME